MAIPALEIEITADPTAADVGFKKIERSLDGLEKATNDYKSALDRINKAERAGIINSKAAAAAVRGAEQAYESAARTAAQYSGAQVNLQRATTETARSMRFGSSQLQNIGFQVGDFATQVGAGTSASQALGQQLPQLLGGFGALGAVMGAAAAIGVPLAAALLSTGEEAKTLEDRLEELAAATRAYRTAVKDSKTDINDLVEVYGDATKAAQQLLKAQRDLTEFTAKQTLNDAISDLSKSYGDLSYVSDNAFNQIANKYDFISQKNAQLLAAQTAGNRQRVQELTDEIIALGQLPDLVSAVADEYDSGRDAAQDLLVAIRAVQTAEGPTEQANAAAVLAQEMRNAAGSMEKLEEIGKLGLYQALVDAGMLASDLAGSLGDAADNANAAADALDRVKDAKTGLSAGKDIAGAFAGIGGEGAMTEFMFGYNPEDESPYLNAPGQPSVRRGRSGSKKKDQPDRIGALAKSLMDESELLENWRAESMTALEDFNALELEALGGHAEAKLRIEEEYMQRLRNIQDAERKQRIDAVSGALGDVATLMNSENKKLFNIGKAASIANATIKGYEAAVEAWDKGMKIGGPPVAAAFTAASLVKTGSLISSIASQQIGGGSGGAPSGGAASTGATSSAAAPAIPTQTVAINLQGDTFSRSSVEGLLEQIQSQLDRGGRLVFQ